MDKTPIAIYRIQSVTAVPEDVTYIGLLGVEPRTCWFAGETLFELSRKIEVYASIDWILIEKQVRSKGTWSGESHIDEMAKRRIGIG
jgi:hypothetical protein